MAYNAANIFAKIIKGEVPCQHVYEDDMVLAFHDINKAAPIHILLIPKKGFESFDDFIDNASEIEVLHFFKVAKNIANDFGLGESGYRLVTNHGDDALQTVKHFHLHILGGSKLGVFADEAQNH